MAKYADPNKMKLGEFLEWYKKEYDNTPLVKEDYTRTIDLLNGYMLGKGDSEEHFILSSALHLLRGAENFFAVTKYSSICLSAEDEK